MSRFLRARIHTHAAAKTKEGSQKWLNPSLSPILKYKLMQAAVFYTLPEEGVSLIYFNEACFLVDVHRIALLV